MQCTCAEAEANRADALRIDRAYLFWCIRLIALEIKRLQAYFYQTPMGREPAREWLKGLSVADRKIIGTDIKDVECAWPLGKPLVDSLGRGLWEVRSSITPGIARVIFHVDGDRMVLLHGFVKKTRKTPDRELDLALKRTKG